MYDGYKAYKSAGKKGWALAGSVAWASGSSFVKVGHLKKAGKMLGAAKGRSGKQSRLREIAKDTKVSRSLRGEIQRDINQMKRKKKIYQSTERL